METVNPRRIIILLILLVSSLLCGCKQDREQLRQLSRYNRLMIEKSVGEGTYPPVGDSLDVFLREVVREKHTGEALVCFVNNSCSVCVGDFCLLAKSLSKFSDINVIAVTDQYTQLTFQYYLDKTLGSDAQRVAVFPVDELSLFFISFGRTQAFLVSDDRVKATFSYPEGKLALSLK